jgi:hypothetical protein
VTAEDYRYYGACQDPEDPDDGQYIEGFVLEDAAGYMVKVKLWYYNFWKHMRSVAESLGKYGHYRYTSSLTTPLANQFHGFLKTKTQKEIHDRSIISLRDEFYKEGNHA